MRYRRVAVLRCRGASNAARPPTDDPDTVPALKKVLRSLHAIRHLPPERIAWRLVQRSRRRLAARFPDAARARWQPVLERGYALVFQNLRGTQTSGGVNALFAAERADGVARGGQPVPECEHGQGADPRRDYAGHRRGRPRVGPVSHLP